MKVSKAVDACLEYHRANSGKKYADHVPVRPRAIRTKVREKENR
jgi:hypothetical protein